jgi:hypothetical protein
MNIYWWRDNQQIVTNLNSTRQVPRYDWFLRDTLPVDLYVVEKQSNVNVPFAVTAIEATQTISFGAKEAYTDTSFLFSSNSWTPSGSGDSQKYTGEISLNTAELIEKIGTSDYLDVVAEFTILNADNSNVLTTQFDVRVTQDVISGSEGTPTTQYPVIAQYTTDGGEQAVRLVDGNGVSVGYFKNGAPYVYIAETGLWYPLTGAIIDGKPSPAFGAGEVL